MFLFRHFLGVVTGCVT